MGYDITAYALKTAPVDLSAVCIPANELGFELAYLEMGSHSADARALFVALDASDHDGQVSGTGIGRCFARDQLEATLRCLCQGYVDGVVSARTLRFVAQVVERMADSPYVFIEFA
jgi:hypothetical protein